MGKHWQSNITQDVRSHFLWFQSFKVDEVTENDVVTVDIYLGNTETSYKSNNATILQLKQYKEIYAIWGHGPIDVGVKSSFVLPFGPRISFCTTRW